MSFVEFLLKYYIYILAVLVVLIVAVIGFLVDSKNKEKKKKGDTLKKDVQNNNGGQLINNEMNNNEPLEQPQVQGVSINNERNVQTDVIQQPQMIDNNVQMNGLSSSDSSNELNNVMPSMVNAPINDSVMPSMMTNQNVNPVIEPTINLENTMVNNQVQDNMMGIPNIQPDLSSMNVNPQVNVNSVLGTNMSNSLDDNNELNVVQGVQPIMNSSNMSVSPVVETPVNLENTMVNNQISNNMMENPSIQPEVSNMNMNQVPIQPVQSQGNVGLEQSTVANLNNNFGFVDGISGVNQANNGSNVQPIGVQASVDTFSSNNVMPNMVNPVNVDSQNQMVGLSNIQPQVSMVANQQPIMNSNSQIGLNEMPSVNNNVSLQQNNNLPNNGSVVTSDGSQPFDISSMFANNQ